jgi:putative ABC transport system permease protein
MPPRLARFGSAVVIALHAVRRNTLRAALTILGITIGIAAVVTVTALGTGAREAVNGQIANLGSNSLIIFPQSAARSGAKAVGAGSRLDQRDCDALVRESTSIRLAAPFLRSNAQIVSEGQNATATLFGTLLPYFAIRNWKLTRGELWPDTAEAIGDRVVVIGSETARELFGTAEPVGRTVRIGVYPYRVLGVLEEKGPSPFGGNQDEVALMPIATMRSHVLQTRPFEVHAVLLSATSAETTDRARKQTTDILRQRHHIKDGDENDFEVHSQAEFQAMQDAIYGALSFLLISIAAVSLLVGGIGVMNIMLVSVTERTREIGIRMAIGAREADILIQFLMEALVLATLGGLVGTAIGYGAIFAFAKALDWPMKLAPLSLAVALGVSTFIGLVFGFFPARRAARMDPVQALGRE